MTASTDRTPPEQYAEEWWVRVRDGSIVLAAADGSLVRARLATLHDVGASAWCSTTGRFGRAASSSRLRATGGFVQVSAVGSVGAAVAGLTGHVVIGSRVGRWLTGGADDTVVVIDLQSVRTVGPILFGLKIVSRSLRSHGEGSLLGRTISAGFNRFRRGPVAIASALLGVTVVCTLVADIVTTGVSVSKLALSFVLLAISLAGLRDERPMTELRVGPLASVLRLLLLPPADRDDSDGPSTTDSGDDGTEP